MFWLTFYNKEFVKEHGENRFGLEESFLYQDDELERMRMDIAEHARAGESLKIEYSSKQYSEMFYRRQLETSEDIQQSVQELAKYVASM